MKHRSRFDKRGALAFRADFLSLFFEVDDTREDFELHGNVAVVRIEGPLTHHAEWFWDSYDAIKSRAAAAFDSSADVVVLRIDSPGGVVNGCFETAREIHALAATKGKKLVAYADAMAASAGYALACAASEIYLPATGFVGSIGVISTLFDEVELCRNIGLNFAVIASGERKRYGHPNVPISDAAIANTQKQVDTLAGLFFELVSEARGVSKEDLGALEAGMLIGQGAVLARLADGVCTFEELIARLSGQQDDAAQVSASSTRNEENMGWKEALKKAAEEGDEEAKKALGALDGDGEDDDKKESKAEDKDDDDKKESKAEDSDGEDKDDDDKKESKAAASKNPDLSLAATVQSLVAWKADREEKEERERLMASRSDLAPEVVAFLNRQPLDVVRDAVKTLPRGAAKAKGQVAAARAAIDANVEHATQPSTAGGAQTLPPTEHEEVLRQMGLRPAKASADPVQLADGSIRFPRIKPSEARAANKEK